MNDLAMLMLGLSGNNSNSQENSYVCYNQIFNANMVDGSTKEYEFDFIINKEYKTGHCFIGDIDIRARLTSENYDSREIVLGEMENVKNSSGDIIRFEGVIPVLFWGGNTKTSSAIIQFYHNQIKLIHNGIIQESDLTSESKEYICLASGVVTANCFDGTYEEQ